MSIGLIKTLEFVFKMLVYVTLGYIGAGTKVLDDRALEGGNQILASLLLPASILTAARAAIPPDNTTAGVLMMIGVTLAGYVVQFSLTHFLASRMKMSRHMRANFVGGTVLKNIGYLGLPMCLAVLGDQSGFYVGFHMIIFTVIAWTYGVYLFSGNPVFDFRKIFLNNSMLVCYVTILIRIFQIPLPTVVWDTVGSLGSTCTPVSLILIGYMLNQAGLKTVFQNKLLYLMSFLSLVLMPLFTFAMICLLNPPASVSAVLIVLSAVPSATLTAIFAKSFGDGGQFVSASILQQILLSMLTMPVILTFLLNLINYQF